MITDAVKINRFQISNFGECKITSPMNKNTPFETDDSQILYERDTLKLYRHYENNGNISAFEKAGPREKIFFDPAWCKAAILTAGGLCPGLNNVIKSLTETLKNTYGVPVVYGIPYGYAGLNPACGYSPVILDTHTVDGLHEDGGTILGSSRGNQDPVVMLETLVRMGVNLLFCIGGDGTLRAAHLIAEEAMKRKLNISVVGIPKTIDNDINFVPKSFGFDTAVDVATNALRCAHTEAIGAPYGVGLVKLMGRESGFIAASSTLSLNVVNFVLVPESPFKLEGEGGLLPALEKRLLERSHAVIVAAEGAGQDLLTASGKTDASGNLVLGDIGSFLQKAIKNYFAAKDMNVTVKYIDPSYIVRSMPANTNDRVYCGQLGRNAVHAAMAGKTNMVIARMQDRFVHLPLQLVTRRRRKIDITSNYWRSVIATTGQKLA